MNEFAQISLVALNWFFTFLDILLWTRVILSIVTMFMGKPLKLYDIVCFLTEPLLAPIRSLLFKSEFLRNSPFDFSIIVLWLLIDFIKRIIFGL